MELVQSYIHGGGRIGVFVELACDKDQKLFNEVAKDIAMQIAAANPLFLNKDELIHDTLE